GQYGRGRDLGRRSQESRAGRAVGGEDSAAPRRTVRSAVRQRRSQGGGGIRIPGASDGLREGGKFAGGDGGAGAEGAGAHHAGLMGTVSQARLVCPALRWRRGSFRSERAKIEQALTAGVGGFLLFGATRVAVAALTSAVRGPAGGGRLPLAELEPCSGQQDQGLRQLPPPS